MTTSHIIGRIKSYTFTPPKCELGQQLIFNPDTFLCSGFLFIRASFSKTHHVWRGGGRVGHRLALRDKKRSQGQICPYRTHFMATIKQKLAVKELGVNGGNMSKAMKAAGYSESVSKRTDKLANTKGFQELLEEYLPDNFLLGALKEDIALKPQNRKPELELGFKLKKKLIDSVEVSVGQKADKKDLEEFLNYVENKKDNSLPEDQGNDQEVEDNSGRDISV